MSNDRLKFRVWDGEHQKYWYEGMLLDNNGELITTPCDDGCFPEMNGKAIVELCTGVKDKNGNLIYEGDIIHYHIVTENDVYDENVEVIWNESEPSWDLWQCAEVASEDSEIIGNIHEGVRK